MRRTPRALALGRSLRRARATNGSRPLIDAPRVPRLGLDRVGLELRSAPALRLVVLALLLASGAHAFAGAMGLGLRPKRVKASRVAMAVAPPEEDDEIEEPPPEPEPVPRSSAASTPSPTALPSAAAPGPIVPGLMASAGAGAGGDAAIAVGGGGGGVVAAASVARETQPTEAIPPRVLRRAPPQYPKAARARGTSGNVVLQVLVDEHGRVAEVRVVSAEPPGVFDAAAVAAARGWVFEPAREGDQRVPAWVRQTIRFELE